MATKKKDPFASDMKRMAKSATEMNDLFITLLKEWDECVENEADGLMKHNMPTLPKLIKFLKKQMPKQ